MKHLVLNSFGLFLGLKSERLVVYKNKEIIKEIALKSIKTIHINSSGISLSSDLVFACSLRGIKIFFQNFDGFCATHSLYEHKGVNVLRQQFNSENNGKAINLAKEFIIGKIKNQRATILYFTRNTRSLLKLKILEYFQNAIYALKRDTTLNKDKIFGIEGSVASAYFEFLRDQNLLPASFCVRTKRNSDEITNKALKNDFNQDIKKIIATNILSSLSKRLIYNHSKLTLESIIQRQVYKISAFLCENDKKYKSYIFRW